MASKFDLRDWTKRFPLGTYQNTPKPWGTSPIRFCVVEQLRKKYKIKTQRTFAMPCDVFVWGIGEGRRRSATKVGGLPYRSKSKPWPMSRLGDPMTFVAQFSFMESKDLVGDLPGDIMLVFMEHQHVHGDPEVYVEWVRDGMRDLVQMPDLPDFSRPVREDIGRERFDPFTRKLIGPIIEHPPWVIQPCHGVRYRTADFPFSIKRFARLSKLDRFEAEGCCVWRATKIGGAPFLLSPDLFECWHRRFLGTKTPKSLMDEPKFVITDKYLCSLASIFPATAVPYPWINQRKSISDEAARKLALLEWREGGGMHFFLGADGQVRCKLDPYD